MGWLIKGVEWDAERGCLIATGDIPGLSLSVRTPAGPQSVPVNDQPVIIPLAAIANRREFYDLASDEEAIDAILREHHARLTGHDQSTPKREIKVGERTVRQPRSWREFTPAERGAITGGLDTGIAIEHLPAARAALVKILAES